LCSVPDEDAPAKVDDPLLTRGPELLNCIAEGAEFERLGTPCDNSAPMPCWPSVSEPAAKLLTPADGTASAAGPYTGDGIRNAEDPSFPDDTGSG
jgi:hypothetical protein